jgi:hypothetical protein
LYSPRVMRALPLLVTVLTGCTFYVSGGSGDGGGGSDAPLQPDAFLGPDLTIIDEAIDTVNPPLADAAIDSLFPPFDVNIPPFDAFVLDVIIPPFDVNIPLPDAAVPDAPPTNTLLETLMVPCNGQVVTSQLVYSSSLNYRVRASGQCEIDEFLGSPILADAEYQGTLVPRDKDNGVDTGIALYDTTLGSTKLPHWGNYTSTHVYEVTGPGYNVPVTARYHDKANNAYGDNSGALKLEIFLQ